MASRTDKTNERRPAAGSGAGSRLVSYADEPWGGDWRRERLISLLFRTGIRLQTACDKRFREFGVTAQDAALLLRCAESGETTQGKLALAVGRDKSKITRFVSRMEPRGLVSRKINAQDRRLSIIRVTNRGRKLAPLLKARFEQVWSEIFRGVLDVDLARLEEAFAALEANAEQASGRHLGFQGRARSGMTPVR